MPVSARCLGNKFHDVRREHHPCPGISLLNGGIGSEDWRMNDGDEVLISLVALVVCTVLLIYFFVYF
jgi:hypothetical protein